MGKSVLVYARIHHGCFGPRNELSLATLDTVDGQNPAPPRMMIIPLFIGF